MWVRNVRETAIKAFTQGCLMFAPHFITEKKLGTAGTDRA